MGQYTVIHHSIVIIHWTYWTNPLNSIAQYLHDAFKLFHLLVPCIFRSSNCWDNLKGDEHQQYR